MKQYNETFKKITRHPLTHIISFVGIGVLLVVMFVRNPQDALGRTYTFTQSSWAGGYSALTASSNTDQTGWTKFSTSTNITAGATVSAAQTSYSATDSTTLTTTGSATGGTFGAGTNSNTINGSSIGLSYGSIPYPWSSLASSTIAESSSQLVSVGTNIYELQGNSFYVYNTTNNTWTQKTGPGGTGTINALSYPGSGDYIYAVTTGTTFMRYSISGDSWSSMTSVPTSAGNGASIIATNNDFIYFHPGNAKSDFYRYSISGNTWTAMASSTNSASTGAAIAWAGGDFIYLSNPPFQNRYSISGNSWTTLSANGNSPTTNASYVYPGGGDYIYYFMKNGSVANIFIYSISHNNWSTRTSFAQGTLGAGMSLVYSSSNSTMYALIGNGTKDFYRYDYSNDLIWPSASVLTAGSNATYSTDGTYVYAVPGTGSNSGFTKLNIGTNAVTSLTNMPISPTTNASVYANGFVYLISGTSMYRYSTSGNSWSTALATFPMTMSLGQAIYPGSGDFIYAFGAGTNQGFYKYSISGNSWTQLTNIPVSAVNGAMAAYPGSGDYIYVYAASSQFYKYSISGNSWTQLTNPPAGFSTNSGFVAPGGDSIYMTMTSQATARYSISGNSWMLVANSPTSASSWSKYMAVSGKLYMSDGSTGYKYTLPYLTSGTFTSAVIDTGASAGFTTLSYSATTPTNTTLTIDVRAGNTATPDGTWTQWQTNVASGGGISGLAGYRYVQYRANLATTDTTVTPTLSSVTFNYTQYPVTANLIGSAFDSGDPTNVISALNWNEDANVPANSYVTVSLRTAATSAGLSSSSWTDFTATTTNCSKVSQTVTCSISAIPSAMKDGVNDRWVQYKIAFSGNGAVTPTVSQVAFQYVVNVAPDFDPSLGSGAGATASQISSSGDANYGKVAITYGVRDTDTTTGSANPGFITPSFEYNTGSGWNPISSQYLRAQDVQNQSVDQTVYTQHTAYWNVASQLSGHYYPSVQIRVTANDNEAANNIATTTTAAFVVDAKNPVISSFVIDAGAGTITFQATDDTAMQYVLSNNTNGTSDGVNPTSGQTQSASTSINSTIPWTFATSSPTVTVALTDSYGNTSTSTAVAPAALTSLDLKDTTNVAARDYREFISWNITSSVTGATFAKYEIYRSTNGSSFSHLADVTSISTNYYTDTSVLNGTTYYYKVRVVDTDGDASAFSAVVNDNPDGQGGTDVTAPIASNIQITAQSTWAKITWTTDEIAKSKVEYSQGTSSPSYNVSASDTSYTTSHSITLSNLTPGTTYLARVISTDVVGNIGTDDNNGSGYTVTTIAGPAISAVAIESVNDTAATITWNTQTSASSLAEYSTDLQGLIAGTSVNEAGNATLVASSTNGVYKHLVTITGLSPQTTYYFYVKSIDSDNNVSTDINSGSYYSFSTTLDKQPPTISNILTPVVTSDSIVIVWTTDKLSDSTVLYGTERDSHPFSVASPTMTISHVMTLSNLDSDTMYYFVVRSKDAQSNQADSDEQMASTTVKGTTRIVYAGHTIGNAGTVVDTTPPIITNISASSTQAFSATVKFYTDKPTTSFVMYGKSDVSENTAGSSDFANDHTMTLRGLQMGTKYQYKIRVTDRFGNTQDSNIGTFTTTYVAESMKDLTTLSNASDFADQLDNLIQSVLPTLSAPIISDIKVANTTEDSATITWKTNSRTYSNVLFTPSENYKADAPNPYTEQLSQTDQRTQDHAITLTNLISATKYHFQVQAYALPGVVSKSDDNVFTTTASKIKPEIAVVHNNGLEVRWITPKKTNSIVEYTNKATGELKRVQDPNLVMNHSVSISDLAPNTPYTVSAFGYDENNVLLQGDAIGVRTSKDTQPPTISNVKIDNALIPGRNDLLQTVVSWLTDEPSTSKVYYEEGVGTSTELKNLVRQDSLSTEHILIIPSLKPSTVYRFKIVVEDQAGNVASSPVKTILTPKSAENVLDVIIKNLQKSFGFLQKI